MALAGAAAEVGGGVVSVTGVGLGAGGVGDAQAVSSASIASAAR